MKRFLRLFYLLRNVRNYGKDLNRRAVVEQQLWNCANGKAPLPDPEQCREWALKLGVPECFKP